MYETDFYFWTQEQVKLLQEGHWSQLDAVNLAKEIEALSRREQREVRQLLRILLAHLLRWEFQPSYRSGRWFNAIQEQRDLIEELIEDSPSLKGYMTNEAPRTYFRAVKLAIRETSLGQDVFPMRCPYSLEQVLDFNYFPS